MESLGIKICCLGASNTRILVDGEGRKIKDMNYPTMLGLRLRTTVRNYGVSGANITPTDQRDDSYIERAPDMEECDLVIVQGEGNDAIHGVPLGEAGDSTTDTYCGSVRSLIRLIREKQPKAKLLMLSGMRKKRQPVRADGLCHDDFHRAYLAVCSLEGLRVIDFYTDSELDPEIREAMPDGVHMSERACMHYADRLSGIIRAMYEAKEVE